MSRSYDLVIIGSGSIGTPVALEFAKGGHSVLVLDSLPSPGQGQHKKAIGGIRTGHASRGSMLLCRRSIEIFSSWKDEWGDDIGWRRNGYSFPAYTKDDEESLRGVMVSQQLCNLPVEWLSPGDYLEINPGMRLDGLRGCLYSKGDGSANPLIFIQSCYSWAKEHGARFRFNEKVIGFEIDRNSIVSIRTNKETYHAAVVLNASGTHAREVSRLAEIDLAIRTDCHEAGVTEPVKPLIGPMIVDARHGARSAHLYLYQDREGQLVFCLSPHPSIWGTDERATSSFLPELARRMVQIMPNLAHLKVRRTWRGQFSRTPDERPIVGKAAELENFYQAVGMEGIGFMLGPAIAELIHRLITGSPTPDDQHIIREFDPCRDLRIPAEWPQS